MFDFTEKKFKSLLNSCDLKATPARLKLLKIFTTTTEPLSVKELIQHFKGEKTDAATLYRNMESLITCGILKQIRLQDRRAYYEYAHSPHHHHLICEKCAKIVDLKNCEPASLDKKVLQNNGFTKINSHSLEFYGLCNSCAKKLALAN